MISSGDDGEFAGFMASQQYGLLRFATALGGDGALADEVVSAALARAFERWHRIRSVERPDAYVRRMVLNEFLHHKRRERRHTVLRDDDGGTVADPADRYAVRDDLRARLATLPTRQRAAVVLRYLEDRSDHEIAEVLDCAEGTVRSLVSRALATLRVGAPVPSCRAGA